MIFSFLLLYVFQTYYYYCFIAVGSATKQPYRRIPLITNRNFKFGIMKVSSSTKPQHFSMQCSTLCNVHWIQRSWFRFLLTFPKEFQNLIIIIVTIFVRGSFKCNQCPCPYYLTAPYIFFSSKIQDKKDADAQNNSTREETIKLLK